MNYLCLVCFEEELLDAFTQKDSDTLTRDSLGYNDELKARGHYLGSNALERVSTATTVRVRNGRMSATDGPFAETKEQLGGYVLIEARDLNEAIQIAAEIPLAKLGSIEIRPIMPLKG